MCYWTPQAVEIGTYDVNVTATDGLLSVSRSLRLIAAAAPVPPSVRIEVTPSFPVAVGQQVQVQVVAVTFWVSRTSRNFRSPSMANRKRSIALAA